MIRRHNAHAIQSLKASLRSLRTRSGLTVDRLRATELALGPLLDLEVVGQVERSQQVPPEEAIVAVVRAAAAQLDVADMLIVDAALALGLLPDLAGPGTDGPDLSRLYAPDLSDRREALVASWATLHELVGAPAASRPPTVRTLRTELESRALERLAERILAASPLDVAPEPRAGEPAARAGAGRVVVIGAAVMDHIYAVDHVPAPGTAVQATSWQRQPGGKGLNQAVAAARLGMETHLVTVIGDDDAGRAVLSYLSEEGVRTDLIRVAEGATTPTTVIMVAPDGKASTIGWSNQDQISLTVRDVQTREVTSTLQAADAVLLTFTVAGDTVEAALEAAARSPRHPTVVLRPSPPYDGPRFAHDSLKHVDYLVGTQWDLRGLLPAAPSDLPRDLLSRQLLVLGVGTVCIAEEFGCTLRSNDLAFDVPPLVTAFKETPGARDAFMAALALRIHQSDGRLAARDVAWATAAMASSATFGGVANSMPTRAEVERTFSMLIPDPPGTGDSDDVQR